MDATSDAATIPLRDRITLDNVHQLHKTLVSFDLAQHKTITIDADDLIDIDFSGLQVLLAFIKEANLVGASVSWDNIPIELYQIAAELDFCDHLKL